MYLRILPTTAAKLLHLLKQENFMKEGTCIKLILLQSIHT